MLTLSALKLEFGDVPLPAKLRGATVAPLFTRP